VAVEPQQISIPVPKTSHVYCAICDSGRPRFFPVCRFRCASDKFPCHIWGTSFLFFSR
jgi:hypothetical protein